jgi:cell division protease FtsH
MGQGEDALTPSGLGAVTTHSDRMLSVGSADVGRSREGQRRRRLWRLTVVLLVPGIFLWYRIFVGRPFDVFRLPHINLLILMPLLLFGTLIFMVVGMQLGAGRSPHVVYRPEQIDVRLAHVQGISAVKEEVVRSVNLFLAHKAFSRDMGGTPRRGLLFEGAPGTGKTYLAKAMAAEAGVPFLFVSATSFQSMFYGATARKIRSYFKALRKVARQEGGAIGFIEEIDAIGATRGGMSMTAAPDVVRSVAGCYGMSVLPSSYAMPALGTAPGTIQNRYVSEGVGGVVNELLVQMQSFDEPTGMQKLAGRLVDGVNLFLPLERQLRKPVVSPTNVLVIAATNRADNLDPALLRPGRFDRRLTFELPDKRGRRELIDHFLSRKAHTAELDEDETRDALAGVTQGYTPVMIEHVFDEALVNAVRRGQPAMNWSDVEHARLTEEVGLGQPVGYTEHEKLLIATHESGHATAAYLVAPHRRLEVLTIVKRRQALGLLAHGDREDVYTRSRSEMLALIQISLAGQAAEELFFDDISTGPGGDLLYATNVAAEMIGSVGMAGTLVSYAAVQNSAFSDTNIVGRVLADPEGRARVEELLQEQKTVVRDLLDRNRHLVTALRDELLAKDELIGPAINRVLDAAAGQPAVIDLRDRAAAPATEQP